MWVALNVLIASILLLHSGVFSTNVWHSNAPSGRRPTIKDCKQINRNTIDCRNMGFQNVPYDVFSISGFKIYLGENPYLCDCSLIWLLREPTSDKKRILDYKHMKCFSPTNTKGVQIKGITREDTICKTKQYRMKDHCRLRTVLVVSFFSCPKNPPRVPYDVYSYKGRSISLKGDFPCDCDTVWLIRRLKTSRGRNTFMKYENLKCKPDKAKGISKSIPIYKVKESQVCRQKANDPCKINPCPAKVTTCKYSAKSYVCVDVNECLKSPCEKPEVCVNKMKTGYKCVCPKGLVRDKATKKCIPPDPCEDAKKPCPSTARCETTRSSSGTIHRCVDIDECLTGSFSCGEGEECRNKNNGYECRCKPGLTREKDKCIAKVDPCKAKPPVCDPKTERCVSESWKSYECLDINECATQEHDCDENAKCINTKPGYKCQCKPGFKDYSNGRKCKDLNECSDKFSCAKHAKCINLPGSYKCECNRGYVGDGKYCNDENECKSSSKCSVDAICKNKLGSFECVCKTGYYGNGRKCKDINECSRNQFKCPSHSKCHNTPGSYTCKCRDGFKFENEKCVDVDECKTNSHNCHKNALCINFVGSYKCRCEDGFEHLKNGRLCLKEEGMSKGSNTLIIIISVSASLLLIILITACLSYQRRKNKNTSSDESQKLLRSETPPGAQTTYMFKPGARK